MKTIRIFSFLGFFLATMNFCFAQKAKPVNQLTTENIAVSGNCGMCKKTIETAARKAGAAKADWDVDKKILAVTFNHATTDAARIQHGIAAAGYDTRDVKADDKAYDKLHACCKYERVAIAGTSCCENDKCGKGDNCCAGMDCCKEGKCTMEKKAEKGGTGHDHSLNSGTGNSMDCCKNGICTKQS